MPTQKGILNLSLLQAKASGPTTSKMLASMVKFRAERDFMTLVYISVMPIHASLACRPLIV